MAVDAELLAIQNAAMRHMHAHHEYRVGERATGQPSPKPPESPHPHAPYPPQPLGQAGTGESLRLMAAGREAWSMLLLYWWGRFRQPRPDGLSEMQKAEWDGGLVDNLTASMSGNGPAMMAVLRPLGLTRLVFDTLLPLWTAVPCYGARGWTGDTHQARRWARIMAEHIASVASASHMGPVSAALEKLGDGPGELDSLWRVFRPSAVTHPDDRAFYDATVADWEQWAFCVPLSQYNEDEARRLFIEAHPDAKPHDVQRVLDSVRVQQMYGSPDPADTINAPSVLIDPKASDYTKGIRSVGPAGGAW